MSAFTIPTLPKDVLLGSPKTDKALLAKTAKAIEAVPQVQHQKTETVQSGNQEAVATVVYLADVMVRLLDKLNQLRDLPLADFNERVAAYISETSATLPEETRELFLNRSDVYASAMAAAIEAAEKTAQQTLNSQDFALLLESLEAAAVEAITLPDEVQAQTMTTVLADYQNALAGGEAAGLLAEGSSALMLADLQRDMALAAAEHNVATADEPTFLALLIASGETGLPEVDALPEASRRAVLEQIVNGK